MFGPAGCWLGEEWKYFKHFEYSRWNSPCLPNRVAELPTPWGWIEGGQGQRGGSVHPLDRSQLSGRLGLASHTTCPHVIVSWQVVCSWSACCLFLQVIKKVYNTKFFIKPNFLHSKKITPSYNQMCTLKHLNTAREWVLNMVYYCTTQ